MASELSTRHASPEPERSVTRRLFADARSKWRRYPTVIAGSLRERAVLKGCNEAGRALYSALRDQQAAVAWLGHASIAASCGGSTVLVDPVLSERIGYRVGGRTIGPQRLQAPPVHPAALRGVDIVLLTHAHFDHLDRPTLRALADAGTQVVAPSGCARLVPSGFGRVHGLRAGGAVSFGDVLIEAIAPAHRGARHGWDRHRQALSYIVRWPGGGALFAGDTAFTSAYEALGGLDIAAFGIGAYNPRTHAHATPEQAWSMFRASGAAKLLPIHHSTFHMSDEPVEEPMARLLAAAGDERERIVQGAPGDVRSF